MRFAKCLLCVVVQKQLGSSYQECPNPFDMSIWDTFVDADVNDTFLLSDGPQSFENPGYIGVQSFENPEDLAADSMLPEDIAADSMLPEDIAADSMLPPAEKSKRGRRHGSTAQKMLAREVERAAAAAPEVQSDSSWLNLLSKIDRNNH